MATVKGSVNRHPTRNSVINSLACRGYCKCKLQPGEEKIPGIADLPLNDRYRNIGRFSEIIYFTLQNRMVKGRINQTNRQRSRKLFHTKVVKMSNKQNHSKY